MSTSKLDLVLEQVAEQFNTTAEIVRQNMQEAMDAAMSSTDPEVQTRWAAIPSKGNKPTLEEFMEYMASIIKQ